MKSQLFNLLTLGLATSGLLAPGAAFGYTGERQISSEEAQHLVCVPQGQRLLCDVEKKEDSPGASWTRESAGNQVSENEANPTQSLKSSTLTVVPPLLTPAQQGTIADILLGFTYFVLPCGLALAIFWHDKYSAYRTAAIEEQIELLERLWKQSSEH
jgi:hypothetical protein